MTNKSKILKVFLVIRVVLILTWGNAVYQHENATKYTVHLSHSALKDGATDDTYFLYGINEKDGICDSFYMDLQSVICLDEVCNVVPVRIYWDKIGRYLNYKLDDNIYLEKGTGEPFEEPDYLLLHKILKQKNSPFKTLSIQDIIKAAPDHDLDGYTGATALVLDDTVSIKGAVLTCYTLWNWAYGDVVERIGDLSGKSFSEEHLADYIMGTDRAYLHFALEQSRKRKLISPIIINAVFKQQNITDASTWTTTQEYIQSLPDSLFRASIIRLLEYKRDDITLAALRLMDKRAEDAPLSHYNKMSEFLTNINTYQSLNSFIGLLERDHISSENINDKLIPFLKGDILMARRVYWFLSEQTLSKEQQKELDKFFKKNSEYL